MKENINNKLIPKNHTIFFDEAAHKYTDELGRKYTSVTTVIGFYTTEFKSETIAKACERIGRNPNHRDYQKYKGKSAQQLLTEWKKTTDDACEFGTKRHNFLEGCIKDANNYNRNKGGFIEGQICTIDDVIKNHNYGKVKLSLFEQTGLKQKYPSIYAILESLVKKGFNIYAEIGVYDPLYLVSGLIDICAINHKTYEFIIVDWKTNKAPIKYECGYFRKHSNGTLNLEDWVSQDNYFRSPLNNIVDSIGNHYAMQLSTYGYLVSTFGYTFRGLVLCHIRPIEQPFIDREFWEESVEIYNIPYMEKDVRLMLDNHRNNNPLDGQGTLIF